jgi:hypothetical protein
VRAEEDALQKKKRIIYNSSHQIIFFGINHLNLPELRIKKNHFRYLDVDSNRKMGNISQ